MLVLGFCLLPGIAQAQEPRPDLPPQDATGLQPAAVPEPRPDVPAASTKSISPKRAAPAEADDPPAVVENPAPTRVEAGSPANGKNPKPSREGPPRTETPASEPAAEGFKPVRPPGARERVVRLSPATRVEVAPQVIPGPRIAQPLSQLVSRGAPPAEDGATKLMLALGALGLAVLVASSTGFLFAIARHDRNEQERLG